MAMSKSKGQSKAKLRDVADAGMPGGPNKKVAGHKGMKGGKNSPDSKGPGPKAFMSKRSMKMPKGCGK